MDVKKMKPGSDPHPCFYAFDVLMLNDVVLTKKSLEDRRKILIADVFVPKAEWLMHVPSKMATTKYGSPLLFFFCLQC